MVHPLALWDAPFLPAALPGPSWPLRRTATLPLAARRQLAAQLVALVAFLLGQGYYPDRGCLRGCVFVRTKTGYWLRLAFFPRWSLDHPRLVQALARGRKGERLPPLLLVPLLNQLIPELRHLLVQVEDPWAFPQVWLRELTSRDRGRAFAHPLGWGRFLWARRFQIPTEAGVFWVDEPGLLDRLRQLPGMQTGEMDEESLARVHARALAAGGPGIFLTATPIPGLPSLPFTGAEAIWCLLPPGSEVEAQRLLAGVMSGDAMAAGVALAETVRRLWAGGERAAEEVEHWLSYRAQRLVSLLAQSGVGLSEAEAAALTGSGEPLRELARFRLVVPRFGRWFWAGGGHGDPAVLAAVAEQLPEGPLRWAVRDEEPTRVLQWCEEALQRGEPARVLGLSPLSRVVPGLSCLVAEAGLTGGWLAWSEPWVRQCSGAVGSVLRAWFAAATGEEEQLQQHLATLTRQREALLPPRLRARVWLLRGALRERAGDEAGARELGLAVLNMPSLPGHLLAEAAYLAGQEALERLWHAPEHGGVPPQRLLHFLGIRAAKRGDYPGALRFFRKALALGGGHNPLQMGELLADAGAAAMLSDQPLEAERFFSAAEFWLKLAGSRRGVRLVTFNRAVLANDRLQWKKAQEFLLRSQEASGQEALDGDHFALIEQARSWLACGRWPEAEAITQKLGPRLAGLPEGHPLKQGWAVVQAHLAVARGQVDQLEFWAAQAEPSE
ncbi:MAG: hypothetical protein RMI39_04965, partial [Thermoanaerobaculum sp.]|nr:hypothetical protein [Thermoanaerobaculum sp.]